MANKMDFYTADCCREEVWVGVFLVPKWLSQPEFSRTEDFSDSQYNDGWIYYGPYWSKGDAKKNLEEHGWYVYGNGSYDWRSERRGGFMLAKITALPTRRKPNRLPRHVVRKSKEAKEK